MILKPLKEVHPNANWNDPQMKSSSLGHCASEYYSITQHIEASFTSFPYTYTLIANMHLSLELVVKAIAFKLISNFNARKFGHKTSKIIIAYIDQIAEFKNVLADNEKMELIQQLESGFVEMRYGETYSSMDRNDSKVYNNLFNSLIDYLRSITNVKFLARHFKEK
jgi:hypothetical protein